METMREKFYVSFRIHLLKISCPNFEAVSTPPTHTQFANKSLIAQQ